MKIFYLFICLTVLMNANPAQAKSCKKIEFDDFDANVGRCEDGTISFAQPTTFKGKGKKSDYEGLCGAVAAANAFHAYCDKYFVIPEKIGPKYFYDVTPGIRPDTLVAGLNDLFDNNSDNCLSGTWKHYYTKSRWDFISLLSKAVKSGKSHWKRQASESSALFEVSPVIVLISKSDDADVLHYVTVVDVDMYDRTRNFEKDQFKNDCNVIYNDFKAQKSTTCKNFAKWARNVDNGTWTSWMHEYNYFEFEQTVDFFELIDSITQE
jgi:hypothetical protein